MSNPCIELWGILLYEQRRSTLERGDAQRRMKQLDARYDHEGKNGSPYFDSERVLQDLKRRDDARLRGEDFVGAHERADELLRAAQAKLEADGKHHPGKPIRENPMLYRENPITTFHDLVAALWVAE